jgi:hypothetical protein
LSLHATLVRGDPGRCRSFRFKPADRRWAGIRDRHPYAKAADGIKRDDVIGRLRMWMRSHLHLSIELVFASHALATVDLGFDLVLQDASSFGERPHDRVSAARASIGVAIWGEPDTLPD